MGTENEGTPFGVMGGMRPGSRCGYKGCGLFIIICHLKTKKLELENYGEPL